MALLQCETGGDRRSLRSLTEFLGCASKLARSKTERGGLSQGRSSQVPSATAAIDCCVRNSDKTRKSRPEGRLNSNAKPAATYSPRLNRTKYHRRSWA